MKIRTRDCLAVLIAVATGACQQADRSSAGLGSEVRDSAGIRIVDNSRPADGSRLPWRIGPEPRVEVLVGGETDDGRHYYALDATKLPDGRIVVADRRGGLSVFEGSGNTGKLWSPRYDNLYGTHAAETGQSISADGVAPWPGDSIIVWESIREVSSNTRSRGISVFDLQGNLGRHFSLSSEVPVDATDDGLIMAVSATDQEDSIAGQLRDSEGALRSSMGMVPAVKSYDADGSGLFWYPETFGRTPVWVPWGELVVLGNTGRYELRAFNVDGSLVRIIRRDHVLRPTTENDVKSHIDRVIAGDPWGARSGLRQRLESVPVADHLPAFARVLSDPAGHLWVQEYQAPREEPASPRWTVFDRKGGVLGFIETPAELNIFEIGEDYILGTARKSPSDERVQLWRLSRSRTPFASNRASG